MTTQITGHEQFIRVKKMVVEQCGGFRKSEMRYLEEQIDLNDAGAQAAKDLRKIHGLPIFHQNPKHITDQKLYFHRSTARHTDIQLQSASINNIQPRYHQFASEICNLNGGCFGFWRRDTCDVYSAGNHKHVNICFMLKKKKFQIKYQLG